MKKTYITPEITTVVLSNTQTLLSGSPTPGTSGLTGHGGWGGNGGYDDDAD